MAFGYNKVSGSAAQVVGDLIAGSDPQRDTKIDFGDDQIDLVISGSTVLSVIKGAVSVTGSFAVSGDISAGAQFTIGTTSEKLTISSGGTGSVTYDTLVNSVFYNSGPTGNITANFTNMSTTSNRATSATVILSQSATPRTISAVQINSTSSTINWANKVTPTPNANQYDIFGFSLIRSGSTWITLGQMSTYG